MQQVIGPLKFNANPKIFVAQNAPSLSKMIFFPSVNERKGEEKHILLAKTPSHRICTSMLSISKFSSFPQCKGLLKVSLKMCLRAPAIC